MIDDDVDQALAEQAARDHTSKASLIRRYVSMGLRPVPPLEDDPLADLVGLAEFAPSDVDEVVYRA